MTRTNLTGILLVVLVCGTNGCAGPLARFEAALEEAGVARFATRASAQGSVEVRASLDPGTPAGRGAVVGDRWVLTVEHVLQGRDTVFVSTGHDGGWVEATVTRRQAGAPEALVLLEVAVDEGAYGLLLGFEGFDADAILRSGAHGEPTAVVTGRGAVAWRPGVLGPGDSGSPVVDDAGRLVGLVSGRRGDVGVYVEVLDWPDRRRRALGGGALSPSTIVDRGENREPGPYLRQRREAGAGLVEGEKTKKKGCASNRIGSEQATD